MFRAVESTAAKGYGGKKDYDNPNFRMQMASSAGAPIRSMIISGGMKGGVLPGMLEMANGHFFRGIWKMLTGGEKMPSLYACMMNLVFRCMAQDKPGQPHDYAAERKRNDRKPPRPAKGVTVRLGELGGLSAEFAIKRERFSTFTAVDLLLFPRGSGGQSASISQPTTAITA